jgi:hypothetical protein
MMPKPRLVGFILAGALLAAAVSVRADSRPAVPASTGGGPWAKQTTVRGVVRSVGPGKLLLLRDGTEPRAEMALVLDAKTIVMRGRKVLTVKDLQGGAPVTVAYVEANGRAVATRIWLRSADKAAGTPAGVAQTSGRR